MIVGIQDEILRLDAKSLLKPLLVDKTTKKNIVWATDAYENRGAEYGHDQQILPELITDGHSDVIKTRARKELEQQSQRTRTHAEVFTPLWVCNKMNNYADEVWFGKPDVFNKDGVSTYRVEFPKDKDWRHYVDSRRMEITCGEAPYLVSRYDVSTGEGINVRDRIGILDRKLRVVNENATSEEEWITWAIRAFEATYGYEFQGDNVLIARVNLLMTFEEYLENQWHRKPTDKEYRTIVRVITWNLWQMDGLTGTVPYCEVEEEYHQMNLFDYFDDEELGNKNKQTSFSDCFDVKEEKSVQKQKPCRIFDWRSKYSLTYLNMLEKNK